MRLGWAGSAFAAFYKDPAGANTLIGNYSLVFTPVDANTVKLTFPSNFDAATLFTTTGPYRLIETYFPTPNFTQPQPLVIGFTVTVRAFMRVVVLFFWIGFHLRGNVINHGAQR